MVELVDTQDLESCEETRAGSIPVIRTNMMISPLKNGGFYFCELFISFIYILTKENLLILNIER